MPRHRGGRKRPQNESEQNTNADGQALEAIGPIQLTFEHESNDGTVILEKQQVNIVSIFQAQKLIRDAIGKNKDEQTQAIKEAIRKLYPYYPRQGQTQALRQLVYFRKYLILIAQTSFGKSMILQAVSLLLAKSITLVIIPLNRIGTEQTKYIEDIGGRPCFLNRETFSSRLLEEIKAGEFTHILLSPELAIGDKFRQTAIHPSFQERLALVVVDEVHLVMQWGKDFRTDYARLHQLRSLFGRGVPWFACSATLDEKSLCAVTEGLGFQKDVEIVRTSINRPELLIQMAWIPKGGHEKALALRFLFDNTPDQPVFQASQIPKTLIFFDTKNDAYNAMDGCRHWLRQNKQPEGGQYYNYNFQEALDSIKVYHSDTAKVDQDAMIQELQKPGSQSKLRVLMTTEALALGMDLLDITQVVIYRFPRNLEPATLWQRGGRACRLGQNGKIIVLVEQWIKGHRKKLPTTGGHSEDGEGFSSMDSDDEFEEESAEEQEGSRSTLEERRAKLPEFWYHLANQPRECLRKQFLDYFDEPEEFRDRTRHNQCCSNCNPEYQLDDPTRYLYTERGSKPGKMDEIIIKILNDWGKEAIPIALSGFKFQACLSRLSCLLAEKERVKLATHIQNLTVSEREAFQAKDLKTVLGSWPWSNQLAEDLVGVLKRAYRVALTESITARLTTEHGQQGQKQLVTRPRSTPKCSVCKQPGHNRLKCPMVE